MTQTADGARRAGRGLVSITGAKVYFIVTSYALQLALPRLLGSAERFGLFSSALNVLSILNNVLIAMTIQSVSKFVSENPNASASTLRQALRQQAVLGALLGGGALLASEWLARDVLLDPSLLPLLRVGAVVPACYAVYAALVGSLNGRHLFQKQARLDITFSTLRTVGILAAAAAGLGAVGAMGGFALAAGVVLVVALATVGTGAPGTGAPVHRWVLFMAPLFFYQACLNGVLQIDLAVLKRTVSEVATSGGVGAAAAAELSSRLAGYYRAAQTFAFVPYQLNLSLAFIVFPMISQATSLGDLEATRRMIRNAMRFALLLVLGIAAPIAGAADGVMRLAYPPEYLAGSEALRVLVLAMAGLALFTVATTVLTGAGRPLVAALIAAAALVVVMAANRGMVMAVGVSAPEPARTLGAAATGTAIGIGVAVVAVAVVLYAQFRAFVAFPTAVRGLLAGAASLATAYVVPHGSRATVLVALGAGFAAFVGTLVVTRELGRADLATVRRITGRGAGQPGPRS